jgi:hypothetical protein
MPAMTPRAFGFILYATAREGADFQLGHLIAKPVSNFGSIEIDRSSHGQSSLAAHRPQY